MKFGWCTITVNNMEESLQFYRDILGLPLNRRFTGGPDIEICFLGEGDTQIELICNAKLKTEGTVDGVTLGFLVDSLEQTMGYIREKGLTVDSGPFRPNPHIQFFYVRDPNGVKIQFAQNM